jgi:hypothetical protein
LTTCDGPAQKTRGGVFLLLVLPAGQTRWLSTLRPNEGFARHHNHVTRGSEVLVTNVVSFGEPHKA